MSTLAIVIFIILWLATFFPAWRLLLKLIALSVADKPKGGDFIAAFILYRLVIVLPYAALLLFGGSLPAFIRELVVGFVILSILLSIARFFLRRQTTRVLWSAYSFFYDGLLAFYPYNHLLDSVEKRIRSRDRGILDAGCGTGNLTRRLAGRRGVTVTAFDANGAMIRAARRKLRGFDNVTLQKADVLGYLGSDGEKFDAIILVNVLYAVGEHPRLWRLALQRLKPGGRLIVTNSDRGGSWPIIKEHLRNDSWLKLLHPRLLGVFVVDYFISQLAAAGKFDFIGLDRLEKDISGAGGRISDVERCYGGPREGVNLLFTVTPRG